MLLKKPLRVGVASAVACAAALALVGGVWATAQPAGAPAAAPVDLLAAPAPATRQGARKLLVDVATAGKRLVAVGEFGLIVRSDDQGASWVQSPSPTSVMLTAVSFADERNGWAVGHDGVILATRDGGTSWAMQFNGQQGDPQMLEAARAQLERTPERAGPEPGGATTTRRELAEDALASAEAAVKAGPSRPLFAVRFSDANNGFAAGAFGQLFHTADGGQHWAYIGDRIDNLEGLHLNSITLTPDGDVLVAAEAGTVFRSRDRGRTWARTAVGYKGYLYGVLALPKSVLVAYGFKGNAFRSADGGTSWTAVPSRSVKTIVAGTVRGEQALLIDEEGQLLVSSDAGESFKRTGERLRTKRLSAFVMSGDTLVAVGMGGAITQVAHLAGAAGAKP